MNAILGALLALVGAGCGLGVLLTGEYRAGGIPVVLVCAGLMLLLRHRRDDEDASLETCSTCRGAGTVYSDEWNDWRRSGPVHTIRELCPTCQGAR